MSLGGLMIALALGLILGSFVNVVIYRGPALWGLLGTDRRSRGTFLAPRSHCPACRAPIRPVDLMPLAGFLRLKGKCAACGAPIPLRYPVVEALGAAAAAACYSLYGASPEGAAALAYLLSLLALAAIDHETGYLPDALTLPLVAAGLAAGAAGLFVPLADALIGAAAGYVAFWAIGAAYRRLREREGLGLGDAKLLAAAGAWSGWAALPWIVLLGAMLALAGAAALRIAGRRIEAATPIRFGPALCAAAAAAFLAMQVVNGE